MTENETKLEQCRKDKAAIAKLEEELVAKVEAEKKPKAFIRILKDKTRVILNLKVLSSEIKKTLKRAIDDDFDWISIGCPTRYYLNYYIGTATPSSKFQTPEEFYAHPVEEVF